MNTVRFCCANTAPDFYCPVCAAGLDVDEWLTENGDPIEGEVMVVCPSCNEDFIFITEITYEYSGKK